MCTSSGDIIDQWGWRGTLRFNFGEMVEMFFAFLPMKVALVSPVHWKSERR
jgi:hypothetical protein